MAVKERWQYYLTRIGQLSLQGFFLSWIDNESIGLTINEGTFSSSVSLPIEGISQHKRKGHVEPVSMDFTRKNGGSDFCLLAFIS